jgi:hypothetical protein
LRALRTDEFDECIRLLYLRLTALLPAAQEPLLNTFYGPFRTHYLREEEMMKPIMASPLTATLEDVNRERRIEVNGICHIVETNAKNEFEPIRKSAAMQLLPIVHAYRGIGSRTLTGTTSYERNFIYDMQLAENAAAVGTLGLGPNLTRAASLNQQFEDFLLEREHKWQQLHHGSLKPLRREISAAFRNLAEGANLLYLASVINGAPSAALEAIIDEANDILRPFRRLLAHRGVHVPADSDAHQHPDAGSHAAPEQQP